MFLLILSIKSIYKFRRYIYNFDTFDDFNITEYVLIKGCTLDGNFLKPFEESVNKDCSTSYCKVCSKMYY